ncbi:hypothetical protein JY471_10825, partial [Stenotrophomonas maltophilia]|nr:hypothetical protein [Stenotrophomonas maltophilia]
ASEAAETPPLPRKNHNEKSEFGFTETLSAATILVLQAIALDAAATDGNSIARVDIAETAVFLSITCCITTRHREPTLKPPTSAPPRCVRFLCSYLLPNQQVRDEPACKQQTHRNSSKTRTRPGAGFFISGPGFRRNHHEQRHLQNQDQHHHDASWWLCLCDARRLLHRFPLTGRHVASTTGRSFSSHRKEPPP